MTIDQQIKYHLDHKKYCKITRKVGDDSFEHNRGYILDCSGDFLLMQETEDFSLMGYLIFPVSTVTQVRYNNNDKYYDKIMRWEKQHELVLKKHDIDLTNWPTIFRTIKKAGFQVIIENENPDDETFDIGPIIKVSKTAVYTRYFSASGYLNSEPTTIRFDQITIVKFDDRYINVFSKYLRERKKSD